MTKPMPSIYPNLYFLLFIFWNSDIEIIEIDDDFIRNINTPEEFKAAHKEINEE